MDADPAGNSILFNLLLLLFFTLLNAFFAGAEMAVVSVNKNRILRMRLPSGIMSKKRFDEVSFDDSGCDHICGILFVGIGSVGDFACSGAVT